MVREVNTPSAEIQENRYGNTGHTAVFTQGSGKVTVMSFHNFSSDIKMENPVKRSLVRLKIAFIEKMKPVLVS